MLAGFHSVGLPDDPILKVIDRVAAAGVSRGLAAAGAAGAASVAWRHVGPGERRPVGAGGSTSVRRSVRGTSLSGSVPPRLPALRRGSVLAISLGSSSCSTITRAEGGGAGSAYAGVGSGAL